MRMLALDVGDRRIGVAISDASGLIATPLTVIHRSSKAADFQRIAAAILGHGARTLVVGIPLDADDSKGPQALRVERYVAALAGALRAQGLDVPLVLWDEHGSTLAAQEAMIAAGRTARHRRAHADSAAAAAILQDYLDSGLSHEGHPSTAIDCQP
jgi:putative Holliday junction resolvase